MSRYGIDYKIKTDSMNYSIIGHEGLLRSELTEILSKRMTKLGFSIKKGIIYNNEENAIGYYDTYKYDIK